MQGVGEPAVEQRRPLVVALDLVECGQELGDPRGRDRLAPAQARQERPGVMFARGDVGDHHLDRGRVQHFGHDPLRRGGADHMPDRIDVDTIRAGVAPVGIG